MDADQEHVEIHEDTNLRAKIVGGLTKVAVVSISDLDSMVISRHYTGLGSEIKYIEVYVIRTNKYLGRFETQDKSTIDAIWVNDSKHSNPPTDKDVAIFKKARMTLLGALDKLWS